MNEKKQTRNKKLKNKSIDERNAKPNKPNGKRILREMQSQKDKEQNVERERKPKQKWRVLKVERNGNIEARVAES